MVDWFGFVVCLFLVLLSFLHYISSLSVLSHLLPQLVGVVVNIAS